MSEGWFLAAFGVSEKELLERVFAKGSTVWDRRANTLARRRIGKWEFESLADIRAAALKECAKARLFGKGGRGLVDGRNELRFRHVVGDAKALHWKSANCTFQVASQFNCLEFVGPTQTPEDGITRYVYDYTQGPICAIQCPAAAFFRNYLAPIPGTPAVGQTESRQLNALADVEKELRKHAPAPCLNITGGYLMMDSEGLDQFHAAVNKLDWEALKDKVRVGVNYDAEVFCDDGDRPNPPVCVTQAFCSAPAIAYSPCVDPRRWEKLSKLILEAEYEATLWASVLYLARTEQLQGMKAYLTAVGGGVFGNEPEWIASSIGKALDNLERHQIGIEVELVHYRAVERRIANILGERTVTFAI